MVEQRTCPGQRCRPRSPPAVRADGAGDARRKAGSGREELGILDHGRAATPLDGSRLRPDCHFSESAAARRRRKWLPVAGPLLIPEAAWREAERRAGRTRTGRDAGRGARAPVGRHRRAGRAAAGDADRGDDGARNERIQGRLPSAEGQAALEQLHVSVAHGAPGRGGPWLTMRGTQSRNQGAIQFMLR